ncbi:MAG: DUF3313 domain-containing protein [Planctomycetes bacterium]|nr:DUF3313 domain-containing protein [Planctomycetota bacterium]
MKKTCVLIMTIGILMTMCGCSSTPKAARTGFLSDYSRLKPASGGSYRYINSGALGRYSSFIVDTVDVHFHSASKARELKRKGEMTRQDIEDLTNYMHASILKAINEAGYKTVYERGPGVARIRVAITDIEKTNVLLSAIPTARIAGGAGVGGASMEAEIVDSMTGEQIGAVVRGQSGSRVPLSGLSDWGGAEHAMNEWAKQLKQRLQEAR